MSFLLPAKIKDKLYRFDDAESKYGNSNALLPTALKGAWFKVNNYVPFAAVSFFSIQDIS